MVLKLQLSGRLLIKSTLHDDRGICYGFAVSGVTTTCPVRISRGRVIYIRTLPNLWIPTPFFRWSCELLGRRSRTGAQNNQFTIHIYIYMSGRSSPSVRTTPYLSRTRATARLDSVGSWPDLKLLVSFSIVGISYYGGPNIVNKNG